MRIVYLNPCAQMGGAETSLLELLASIRAAEPHWELWLVLGEDGPLAGRAQEFDVRVIVTPFPPALGRLGDRESAPLTTLRFLLKAAGGTALYARRLAGIVRAIRPQIVHTNGFKMHLLGALARPDDTPVVWHIHDYVSERPLMSRLLQRFRHRCTAAIANSKSVAADLSRLLPGVRIVPVHNAINFERFAPAGPKLDLDMAAALPPAAPGTIRVGLVATFARWKGHKVFLRALSQLPVDAPIRGYVIGGPIYQTNGSQCSLLELQEEAKRLGLDGRVGFTGFVNDPAVAMRSLDIVVHASTKPEPFGMVIVEAMGCEKPVIISDAGGAAELYEEGRTGLGYPPGDATALAKHIERLATDSDMRTRLGAAARAAVEPLFHRRRLASQLLDVYRQCLDTPAERSPS